MSGKLGAWAYGSGPVVACDSVSVGGAVFGGVPEDLGALLAEVRAAVVVRLALNSEVTVWRSLERL